MKDFIHSESVSLPNHSELIEDLASVQYEDGSGKVKLESKKDIRKRLGRSTDYGDALALTFAVSKTRYASKFNWSQPIKYNDLQSYE